MSAVTYRLAATALAVGLLAAPLSQARAEPVNVAAGTGVQITDPSGSGRTVGVLFAGGSSDLTFSTGNYDGDDTNTMGGMVAVIDIVTQSRSGLGGAAVAETRTNWYGTSMLTSAGGSGMSVTGMTADDATGQFLSINTAGGFSLTASSKILIAWGGEARVQNLRFDLVKRQILAALSPVQGGGGKNNPARMLPPT
jgi:hypothetical protein